MHIALDTSTQVSTRKQRSAPIDPQVADRLLDLLSTDDAFRKLFTRDPREALVQVGFVNATDLEGPNICFWGISKREIAAAREEIRTMLIRGLTQGTPKLDTGMATGRHLLK